MSISVTERKIAPQRCSCLNPQWTIHVNIVDQFRSLIGWPWVKRLPWVIHVRLIKINCVYTMKEADRRGGQDSVIWCWGIKSTRADFEGRERGPWAKECRPFLKAGSDKEMKSSLKDSRKQCTLLTSWIQPSDAYSISDFQDWQAKSCCSKAVTCYDSYRKVAQWSPKVLGNSANTIPKYQLLLTLYPPYLLTDLKYLVSFYFGD